jgi:hypothetical protein
MDKKARLLELRDAAAGPDMEFAWTAWAEAVRPHITPVILSKFNRPWVDDDEKKRFSGWWQPASSTVITLDGIPAGWLAFEQSGDIITLVNFVVSPQYRHLGVASIIIGAKMHEWTSTAKKVAHSVLKGSGHETFFERFGFKVLVARLSEAGSK